MEKPYTHKRKLYMIIYLFIEIKFHNIKFIILIFFFQILVATSLPDPSMVPEKLRFLETEHENAINNFTYKCSLAILKANVLFKYPSPNIHDDKALASSMSTSYQNTHLWPDSVNHSSIHCIRQHPYIVLW